MTGVTICSNLPGVLPGADFMSNSTCSTYLAVVLAPGLHLPNIGLNIQCCSSNFYLPSQRRPGMGDIENTPVCQSVCLSVMFSFCTVTGRCIAICPWNFAGSCTMSWGCAV